jgi:hypothetical protein
LERFKNTVAERNSAIFIKSQQISNDFPEKLVFPHVSMKKK